MKEPVVPVPNDPLTAKRAYLETEIRRRALIAIHELSMAKDPTASTYGLSMRLHEGQSKRSLFFPLLTEARLRGWRKRDLREVAELIAKEIH